MHNTDIIYDNEILVVVLKKNNKSMESLNELLDKHYGYCLFPINSLTRESSGLVVFLKDKKYLKNYCINLYYYIVTSKYIETDYIYHISEKSKTKIIMRKKSHSILDIETSIDDEEIRLKLAEAEYPIIGDYKYHSRINPIGRICIHLFRIKLLILDDLYEFSSPIPHDFKIFTI